MVATQNEEIFWVLDLIGEQQADGLQRLLASVYVVPVDGRRWGGGVGVGRTMISSIDFISCDIQIHTYPKNR